MTAQSEIIREALKMGADCLEDVASGRGGWAWEEVLDQMRAALKLLDAKEFSND